MMFVLLRHRACLAVSLIVLIALQLTACSTPLPAISGRSTPGSVEVDGSTFEESFIPGETANWVLEQDALGSSSYVNEQLLISISAPNTMQYAVLDGLEADDFVLEVDAWLRSGAPENSYGVLFRVQDDQQFYRFDVTGTGLYMVERRNIDGTWTRLVGDWMPSPAINQGLNVANRLKVIAAGPQLAFYVNDILLTQVSDSSFATGALALDAGTFSGDSLEASFDNFKLISETR